tara:strand:- start:331 stop:837 length:507 start_codon:yes stop_codon:yes gene_type:complete
MSNSVNLYLALGVYDGVDFWLVDFTEENEITSSHNGKLLECYRKELFGITAAIEVREAINNTLDIFVSDSNIDCYTIGKSTKAYSSDIPLNIIEDIFDLWSYNYNDYKLWKKYIGLLNFRKKIKKNNNYINIGLKGKILEFSIRLDKILRFRLVDSSFSIDKTNELMW